jgi:hypothetical protein
MSHILNGPHLPREKPGRLGYTVLILAALSLLLAVSLSMPDHDEETGKPVVMEGFTEQSAVGWAKPTFVNPNTATFMGRVDQEFSRLMAFDPLHYSRDPGTIGEALVSRPRNKVPLSPFVFSNDGVGPFGPNERFGSGVAVVEVASDR